MKKTLLTITDVCLITPAEQALTHFEDKWKGLSTFYNYHPNIRHIMYTYPERIENKRMTHFTEQPQFKTRTSPAHP